MSRAVSSNVASCGSTVGLPCLERPPGVGIPGPMPRPWRKAPRACPRSSADLKQCCQGNALRLSRWPGPQVHDALGRIWWRVTEPGPRADNTLRMLERIDEVTGDCAAFNLPADGDDT